MSWLADLFAEFFIVQDDGADQMTRATLNFGQGLDVTDNPGQERLDIIVPTTTTTADGLLPRPPASNRLLTSPAGVPTWDYLVDAHVHAAAAIDGTKVSPNFGAQAVRTTNIVLGRHVVRFTSGTDDIVVSDDIVACDTSIAGVTLWLPPAATAGAGRRYVIQDWTGNAGANAISINGDAGETISGAGVVNIAAGYGAMTVWSDGINQWFIESTVP